MKLAMVRLDGSTVEVSVEDFQARLRGELLQAGDPGYEDARTIWNAMIDRRPGAVVRCAGAADVVQAVRFAREHDLLVSVRGGGHNVAGNAVCEGGLMIDLSVMNGIRIDPETRRARVGPGCTLGALDRETQAFGQVVPSGVVTTTGVAGLTVGGGFGWLSRKWGLTCDHLRSADVVTVDGDLVVAREDAHQDLFWGLRGGGGNFGIVTSFDFETRTLGPEVAAGLVMYPVKDAASVFSQFRQFLKAAPNEVTGLCIFRAAPPAPFIPEAFHGKPVAAVAACYAGAAEEGVKVLAPLKTFGNPIADVLFPKPFVTHQGMLDTSQPEGSLYYWKSEYFSELSDELIAIFADRAQNLSSPRSVMVLFQVGGAVSDVGEDETAYGHRNAAFALNLNAQWTDPAESDRHIAWAREAWDRVRPHSMGGGYVNFASQDEAEDRVQGTYGAQKYQRLVALKQKYDPDNFFRMNQNIRPKG